MHRRLLVVTLLVACTGFGLGCTNTPPAAGDGGTKTDGGGGTDGGGVTPDGGGGTDGGGNTDGGGTDGGTPTPTSTTATIGFAGGSLTLDGATLTFPKAALSQDTQITLTHTIDAPPAGFDQGVVVWTIDPATLTLTRPAVLTLPYSGSAANAGGFWSTPDGSTYERVGLEIQNGMATLHPVHLGGGFVGDATGYPTVTVYATVSNAVYTPTGESVSPADLTGAQVGAMTTDANGVSTVTMGTGDANGIVRVTGVPVSSLYYVGGGGGGGADVILTADAFATADLSLPQDGRNDGGLPGAGPSTSLSVTADNMTAWQSSDQLEAFVPNLGYKTKRYASGGTGPAVGDTTLSALDLGWTGLPLVDSTQGDNIYIVHRSLVTDASGVSTSPIVDLAMAMNVTMTDGQATAAQITFTHYPQNQSISFTVDRDAFAQVATGYQAWSGAQLTDDRLGAGISASRAPPFYGTIQGNTDLLDGQLPIASGPLTVGPIAYSDPWLGTWTHELVVYRSVSGNATAGTATYPIEADIGVAMPLGEGSGATVNPALSLPRSLTIGGQAATGPLTGVGASPTIAWQAPATGTPTAYRIVITSVGGSQTSTVTLTTTDTKVTLPMGVLQAGSTYYLMLTAIATPDEDMAYEPFHEPQHLSLAQMTSPPFSP